MLGPVVGVAKSNPVVMTIQLTFMNSAPENNFEKLKEESTENLRMRTIGTLLFLFENNNKVHVVAPSADQRTADPSSDNTHIPQKTIVN